MTESDKGKFLAAGIVAVAAFALFCIWSVTARADDTWISRGQLRNPAGEWCCGTGDCGLMDKGAVKATEAGYEIRGFVTILGTNARIRVDEVVPYAEAMPSPDGAFWRCMRPDHSRRCFFAPPPGA